MKNRKSIAIQYMALLLAPILLPSAALAQDEAGWVERLSGRWEIRQEGVAPKSITKPGAIPRNSILVPKTKDAEITVLLRNNERIRCTRANPGKCAMPLLPAPDDSTVSRIIRAAMVLFIKQSTRYDSPAITKGEDDELQEAVTRWSAERLDLSAVFKSLKQGAYLLSISPIPGNKSARDGRKIDKIDFNWEPDNPAPLSVGGLDPGLYQVQLLNTRTYEHEPLPVNAWILISSDAQYEANASAFQEAVKLTGRWGNEVDRGQARSFLRAYLDHLAVR